MQATNLRKIEIPQRSQWTEEKLDELLTKPSAVLIDDIKKIRGDIIVLGAGGKMGPTLCILISNAIKEAGIKKRVIAVSRFSDPIAIELLSKHDVEIISKDLLDTKGLYQLPETENVLYMAGRKFGTAGEEWRTWAMNATLPAFVADKYKKSNIVVFSSGNIYPLVSADNGGSTEKDAPGPIGDYAMSCLARERAFEYAANTFGTKIFTYRLSFAVDLRYGVLYDIAYKLLNNLPISLGNGVFNCVWQGWANEVAVRALLHCSSPAKIMNITGPEVLSTRAAALKLAKYLGKKPVFEGSEMPTVYLANPAIAVETFGRPLVSAETLIKWQAEWILSGGRTLNKPTHFEERGGCY